MSRAFGSPRSVGWRGSRANDQSEAVLRAAWKIPGSRTARERPPCAV